MNSQMYEAIVMYYLVRLISTYTDNTQTSKCVSLYFIHFTTPIVEGFKQLANGHLTQIGFLPKRHKIKSSVWFYCFVIDSYYTHSLTTRNNVRQEWEAPHDTVPSSLPLPFMIEMMRYIACSFPSVQSLMSLSETALNAELRLRSSRFSLCHSSSH